MVKIILRINAVTIGKWKLHPLPSMEISPGNRPTIGILSIYIKQRPAITRKMPVITSIMPIKKRNSIAVLDAFFTV